MLFEDFNMFGVNKSPGTSHLIKMLSELLVKLSRLVSSNGNCNHFDLHNKILMAISR